MVTAAPVSLPESPIIGNSSHLMPHSCWYERKTSPIYYIRTFIWFDISSSQSLTFWRGTHRSFSSLYAVVTQILCFFLCWSQMMFFSYFYHFMILAFYFMIYWFNLFLSYYSLQQPLSLVSDLITPSSAIMVYFIWTSATPEICGGVWFTSVAC